MVLKKVWWIIPIALLSLVIWGQRGVETRLRENISLDEKTISLYAGKIALQNQQIGEVKAAGERAVATAKAQVVERVRVEKQVEVKWKTQLVPVKVPTDCPGAVAAGAINAAQIGRLFMGEGK